MTPKEKAIQLVNSFYPILGGIEPRDWEYFCHNKAKQCALIAVDEIINEYKRNEPLSTHENYRFKYWQEVKQEIEKL